MGFVGLQLASYRIGNQYLRNNQSAALLSTNTNFTGILQVSTAGYSLAFSPFCITYAFIASCSMVMNLDMSGIRHQPFHVFPSRENEHRFRPDAFTFRQVGFNRVPLVAGEVVAAVSSLFHR